MFNFSPKIITDGLVLHLDAANPKSYRSGSSTWNDLSRGRNNGTLINGPGYSSTNGGNITFDGSNDYVNLGRSSNITGNNIQNFTVGSWIKYSSQAISRVITIQRGSAVNSSLFGIAINETTGGAQSIGSLGFFTRDFNNISHQWLIHSDNYHLKNRYINVCCVIDGTNRYLYLDGQLINFDSGIGMQSVSGNTDPAYLAVGPTGNDLRFAGNISSITVHRKSLAANEVLQNYNATKGRFGL